MGGLQKRLRSWTEKVLRKYRPLGGSMKGKIESGQLVTIEKCDIEDLAVDDVVFIRWKGNYLVRRAILDWQQSGQDQWLDRQR